jgi:DNA primase
MSSVGELESPISRRGRIDVDALRAGADLAEIVGRHVKLRKAGREFSGLCPFHEERSPSFYVVPKKGYVHCFGCGAHHDVIGFLQRVTGRSFIEVCEDLGAGVERDAVAIEKRPAPIVAEAKWIPLLPVPDDAPDLIDGDWTVPVWNPKRSHASRMKPLRVDAYRNARGELLGYVLRMEIKDRVSGRAKKWTPTVTWCIGPDGMRQWCLVSFPEPRPLYGLDDLAAKRSAPVLIPEGEKCRAAGAGALPMYAVVSWPGGGKGISKVDWSPLHGRDVVLWPDADKAGVQAMLGWQDPAGRPHVGIAQLLSRAGVRSIRMIDTEGQPNGWDIADALGSDGWTVAQLTGWAAARVVEIDVVRGR